MSAALDKDIIRVFATSKGTEYGVPFARAVRAGHLVVLPGILPKDFGDSGRPLSGDPSWLRQANSVWREIAELLKLADSDVSRIVRCDQFFVDWRAVPFFHEARRAACGAYIAPSTSILTPELLLADAGVMTDVIALAGDGPRPEPIIPTGLDLPATSSFVPVVRAGEMVFVAGFLAACGKGDLGGIAPEAQLPTGHLWKGNRIQLEASYVIREKLEPALAGAGFTLNDVVKANVFLWDINDTPAFNRVWAGAFKGAPPATTILPTSQPGFAIADARIEINLIAMQGGGRRIQEMRARSAKCDTYPIATRAGDYILFSGLVAADESGLVEAARVDSRRRYLVSSIEAQMEYLLDLTEEICSQNGASLSNVVRIQQAHTDLRDFLPACRVWQRRLPGVSLPISAVRVPAPLVVPGCSVQIELWIYAPCSGT